MNKIKLFSHDDLDGYGCNIVAQSILENVDCENLDYDNVNQRIKEFFVNGEYKNYNKVYITDISVKEDTAKISCDVKTMCGDREIEGVTSIVFDKIEAGEIVMATIKCLVRLGK